MQKKQLLFLFYLLGAVTAFAQTIDRKVIASGGGYYQSSALSVSWTLGETFGTTLSTPSLILTQGFQQPSSSGCNFSLGITSSTVSCHGDNNGAITVTFLGGATPYTVMVNGADSFSVSSSIFLHDSLHAGQYIITVTDAANCIATDTVVIVEPELLQAQVSVDPIACYGDLASVTVTASGGTGPYVGTGGYSVPAGINTFTVMDSLGCSVSSIDTLSAPDSLVLLVSATPILCYGDSSWISVSAIGGTLPYSGTGIFSTPAGTHVFPVIDANGCADTISITVNEPLPLTSSSTATTIACQGGQSAVTVSASGGVPPYVGTGSVSVSAGMYAYVITDDNGCQLVDSILIEEPTSLSASAVVASPITCYGGTGTVLVTAGGGTPPYVDDGLQTVAAGTWSYTVTDANGCSTVTPSLEIQAPSKLIVSSSSVPATCNLANGSISLSVSGGVLPYTYAWSTGQTTTVLNNLLPGTYTATVTDANGCTESVTVVLSSSAQAIGTTGTIVGPAGACRGSVVTYTLPPVTNATSYTWSLPAGATGASTSNTITVNFTGNYMGGFVCVTPGNTCSSGNQACINVPVITVKPSTPRSIVLTGSTCGPSVVTLSVPALANATSYTWSVNSTQAAIIAGQGTRIVQISLPFGFTNARVSVFASNCVGSSNAVYYSMIGVPVANSSLTGQIYVCPNSIQSYSATSVLGATSYSWGITGDATIAISNGLSCTVQTGNSWNGGALTITASNSCGSSSRSFMLRSVPLQPGAIIGPSTGVCAYEGVTTASYSIAGVAGATSYQWILPTGMTLRNANGTSMTANIDTSFRSGQVCVVPVNSCGQGAMRCLAVSAYADIPGAITGPATVCKSDRAVNYTISPVSGAYHYVWAISGGAYLVTVSTGLSSTVDYYWAQSNAALLSVQSANLCGKSSPQQQNITVNLACRVAGDEANELTASSFVVYPNPARDVVTIDYYQPEAGNAVIELIDVLGRELLRQTQLSTTSGQHRIELQLPTEKISTGVFTLRLIAGDTIKELRLVVE